MYRMKLAGGWKLAADYTCMIKWSTETRKPHPKTASLELNCPVHVVSVSSFKIKTHHRVGNIPGFALFCFALLLVLFCLRSCIC